MSDEATVRRLWAEATEATWEARRRFEAQRGLIEDERRVEPLFAGNTQGLNSPLKVSNDVAEAWAKAHAAWCAVADANAECESKAKYNLTATAEFTAMGRSRSATILRVDSIQNHDILSSVLQVNLVSASQAGES